MPPPPFDVLNSPLPGINLIQASAGTGKTYTIATLVVRLVIEHNLAIQRILVVTFTEAATAELRERIRSRLQATLDVFNGDASDDPILAELVARHPEPDIAKRHLQNALRGFDEAAVFTIHGFCRRMLQDSAFESGMLFDTELVTDQQTLLHQIAADFWRTRFYQADPLLVRFALQQNFGVETLLNLLLSYSSKPLLEIIPDAQNLPAPNAGACAAAFADLLELWPQSRDAVAQLLCDPALMRNTYKPDSVPAWLAEMAALLDTPKNNFPLKLPKNFPKFCAATLRAKTKKNQDTPRHVFFDACQDFSDALTSLESTYAIRLQMLKRELFDYAKSALKQRKQRQQIQFFDDLLYNLYAALTGRNGKRLAKRLSKRFPAALIDEFQDTDPLQYTIFQRIYQDSDPLLFLIGDPKQAIYNFRGADIFAYLQAVRDAQHQYTLNKNWRSSPGLIHALNALFLQTANPFMFDEIAFQAVDAVKDAHPLDGLRIWHVSRDQAGTEKIISKGWAELNLPDLVCSEIVRLLNEKSVSAGDIAVLVRTNRQALMMQDALRGRNIPSVLYSRASLFGSHEAQEIFRLLGAVLEPQRPEKLRAALLTDLLGWNANQLYTLESDENKWDSLLQRFRGYQERWLQRGFMPMFRSLLLAESVPKRLLSFADGERRLTNTLHLGEVLQQAWVEQAHTPLRLLQWLEERIAHQEQEQDEFLLRLESDARAVKVVTIHKSKGLEYPVVFVPFAWDGKSRLDKAPEFVFHHAETNQSVLDLGSAEQDANRLLAKQEELAENLRLFYVAVTRAKYRCYIVWGAFNDADTAPPAHLWHDGASISTLNDADIRADLDNLATNAAGAIRISQPAFQQGLYQAPRDTAVSLFARQPRRYLVSPWQITSFSGLLANQSRQENDMSWQQALELPEQDAFSDKSAAGKKHDADSNERTIWTFPAGARSGEFFHAVLEHLDFTAPQNHLSAQLLRRFGFEDEWQDSVDDALFNILHAQLPGANCCLADIPNSARLNELGFFYPIDNLNAKHLAQTLAPAYGGETPKFEFGTIQGMMRGFIDLVFVHDNKYYVVDYKSNYLGDSYEHYHAKALMGEMRKHHYILQYHIYTLALHHYLQNRLPDYDPDLHLGGVFYLFLRGMHPEHQSGIFFAPPTGI